MSELKENRGVLFNAKEKKSENSPDMTGRVRIGDQEFWLSAWKDESQGGTEYLSVAVREKELSTE